MDSASAATVDLLRQSDLFRSFDPEVLELIAGHCSVRAFERNDRLFDAGDAANDLFVVRRGRVAIATRSPDGRESVIALMEEGDLFGEMSLFTNEGRSADARALESSELVEVPYPPIRALLDERPSLLWAVVGFLSRRLKATNSAVADAVFLDVTGRTAKRLLEVAGDQDEFLLPLTQEELASMIGASRERVNKAIASFVRLGWITQADRRYRLTNRTELERRSR